MGSINKTDLEEWQIKAFAGDNYEYYLRKWSGHAGGLYGGWNWVAFFFAMEWLAYRKMYAWAAAAFLVPFAINLALIFSPLHLSIDGKLLADTARILFAIFGNGLYRRKMLAVLEKNKGIIDKGIEIALAQAGGVSVAGLAICILLEVAWTGLLIVLT